MTACHNTLQETEQRSYYVKLESGGLMQLFMTANLLKLDVLDYGRADRDDYVTILWENIQDGLSVASQPDQFAKYSLRIIDHLGAQYDYSSIMHYSATAFSKNGRNTIEPKQAKQLHLCPHKNLFISTAADESKPYNKQSCISHP
uniref:Peptidase M12A domain-containing protein n=1 Tax=Parascaris equorum TaxID=6256 RepID=A0A914RNU2_PAREQ